MRSNKNAFTLAEVLITLGIIGIVAAMVIPTLISNAQNKDNVARLLKFSTNLQEAVALWKEDIACHNDASNCFISMGFANGNDSAFDETVGRFLYIADKATGATNTKDWLPDSTLNYYGEAIPSSTGFGSVAKCNSKDAVYLLKDGVTVSADTDPNGLGLAVDVNGKKGPNRFGKDVFHFVMGVLPGKDIYYGGLALDSATSTKGLCYWRAFTCNTDEVNPSGGYVANPTQYVITHKELPDYSAIASAVSGFKP